VGGVRVIEAGAGSIRLRVAMQKRGMEKSRSSSDILDVDLFGVASEPKIASVSNTSEGLR
jgi:hypothetical protein